MNVSIQTKDFDVGAEIAALSSMEGVGAVASFVGVVRGDEAVTAMTLEHYPGMTERAVTEILEEAQRRWQLVAACVIHRVGRLLKGERIVFVGVSSSHRGDAFAACEFIMDYLKTRAPFWKKEETFHGTSRWVDARESDDVAVARWNSQGGSPLL